MAVRKETSQMSYAHLTDFRASGTLVESLHPSHARARFTVGFVRLATDDKIQHPSYTHLPKSRGQGARFKSLPVRQQCSLTCVVTF